MKRRLGALGLGFVLVLSACVADAPDESVGTTAPVETNDATNDDATSAADAESASGSSTSTTIENYPDAQTRALAALARAPRPVENSAVPPRHLNAENFPETLVDRNRIVSGGVSVDGIPSIDAPQFDSVELADEWLADTEPVIVVTVGDETQIHPVQVLIWHEIVNTDIGGEPIAVTYCPLCNSVTAFRRTVDGPGADETVLDFGVSGALYQSALVMYDRQTESLWTHFDGRSVVGTLVGTELDLVAAATVSWADARRDHGDANVLNRVTGVNAPYGESPYANYESIENAPAGFIVGPVDDRLDPKSRVLGVSVSANGAGGAGAIAVPMAVLQRDGVVDVSDALVAFWTEGQTSAIDGELIAEGVDVGSTGLFENELDGEVLSFATDGGGTFVDDQTGSTWTITGLAIDGPLEGEQLIAVPRLDTFWFAWVSYFPETTVSS